MAYLGVYGGPRLSEIIDRLGHDFFGITAAQLASDVEWERYSELTNQVIHVYMDRIGRLYYPFIHNKRYFLQDEEVDSILEGSSVGLRINVPCEPYVLFCFLKERAKIELDKYVERERNMIKEMSEENISEDPPYEKCFSIIIGDNSFNVVYKFHYKEASKKAEIKGKVISSASATCLDDDHADQHTAELGKDALEAAVLHLKGKYPDITNIDVKPYSVGIYNAW